jgi:hypothetical protein
VYTFLYFLFYFVRNKLEILLYVLLRITKVLHWLDFVLFQFDLRKEFHMWLTDLTCLVRCLMEKGSQQISIGLNRENWEEKLDGRLGRNLTTFNSSLYCTFVCQLNPFFLSNSFVEHWKRLRIKMFVSCRKVTNKISNSKS